MLKFGKQILYILILQMILLATIGVNVVQWNCMRSSCPHWEIRILPEGGNSGEKADCCLPCIPLCAEDCPFVPEHDFYRLDEIPETERGVQIEVAEADVSGYFQDSLFLSFPLEKIQVLPAGITGRPPSSEFLCVYRC